MPKPIYHANEEAVRVALEALMPTNYLLHGPWVAALSWALGNVEIMAEFRHDTGWDWLPGRTAIEQMVDRACGIEGQFILEFARWFNVNIWGE